MKFEISDLPPNPADPYQGDPSTAVVNLAAAFTDTTPVAGEQYGKTFNSTREVLTWALQGGQTPDSRAAFRAYAEAILAANQEPQDATRSNT